MILESVLLLISPVADEINALFQAFLVEISREEPRQANSSADP